MPGIESAKLIDLHAHVRLQATNGAAGRHGPEFGVDADGKPWYRVGNYKLVGVKHTGSPFTDPELRLQKMQEAHIDFQVLSPSPLTYFHHIDLAEALPFCRRHNDAMAELVRTYPDKLGGLAALPMQDPVAAREELHRAVEELGLWGAAIGTEFKDPLHSPAFDPFYESFVKLDVPLFIHPAPAGIDGPPGDPNLKRFDLDIIVGFGAQEAIAVSTLIFGGVLDRHPKLKLVCPHLGGTLPYICGRMDHQLAVLKRGPQNLQRKPSEYLRSIYMDIVSPLPEAMRFALDFSSADKLLFSSDHPWVQPKEILDPFRSLNLPAATEAKILSGNARQLFKL
jgi:aminocarboxymuconate-semialdehyde decarboxylase